MDDRTYAIPLASALVNPAAAVLTRAFYNDPFFNYAISHPADRDFLLPWIFQRELNYGVRHARVYTTPALDGVVIWLGPQKTEIGVLDALRSGMAFLPFKMRKPDFARTMALSKVANRMHKVLISGDHWYLYELGVDPSRQHRGVGSALLQPILKQADLEGIPCYLETNNEVNLRFYEQHGFKVMKRDQAAPDSPYTWGMVRKPG